MHFFCLQRSRTNVKYMVNLLLSKLLDAKNMTSSSFVTGAMSLFQQSFIFWQINFLTRRTGAYQGVRNISFLENFAYVLNE